MNQILEYEGLSEYSKKMDENYLDKRLSLLPKYLYKYRKPTRQNIRCLKDGNAWFSNPESFNDLIDFTFNFDMNSLYEELKSLPEETLDLFKFAFCNLLCSSLPVENKFNKQLFDEVKENCFFDDGSVNKESSKALALKYNENLSDELLYKIENFLEFPEIRVPLESFINEIFNMFNELNDKLKDSSLVYCLAESFKNDSMWANYADNYKGFCIGYQINRDVDINYIESVFPVIYTSKKPKVQFIKLLKSIVEKYLNKTDYYHMDLEDGKNFLKQFCIKTQSWKNEKEWRLIIPNDSNNLRKFPYSEVIYVGKNASPWLVKQLKNIAIEQELDMYIQELNSTKSKIIYIKVIETGKLL